MLKWFADRLAETGKDARKDERGFTLIELLVVVIIIGILAAIAIPTFLAQRDSARTAAVQGDLRSAATAAASCSAANNDIYDGSGGGENCANGTILENYGYNSSADVTLNANTPSPTQWTARAFHTANEADTDYLFDTATGRVSEDTSTP